MKDDRQDEAEKKIEDAKKEKVKARKARKAAKEK